MRVAIVQEYVPNYRRELFDRVVNQLERAGNECVVFVTGASASQLRRKDAHNGDTWVRNTDRRRLFKFGPKVHIDLKELATFDVVIVGLVGSSLDTNVVIVRRLLNWIIGGPRVVLWGHVKPYVKRGNILDLMVERIQIAIADRVFAYTEGGKSFALRYRVPERKMTVLNNTLPTDELESCFLSASLELAGGQRRSLFEREWTTLCYIGALDGSKRVELLADVLDELWKRGSTIRLIIAGRGESEKLLSSASSREQIITIGHVGAQDKALVLAQSEAIVNPGRIGLSAIDSLVSGLPILTTSPNRHAPEVEYLAGTDLLHSVSAEVVAYANLLDDRRWIQSRKQPMSLPYPRIEDMVLRFVESTLEMSRQDGFYKRSQEGRLDRRQNDAQ